jgi:hypothetical protein
VHRQHGIHGRKEPIGLGVFVCFLDSHTGIGDPSSCWGQRRLAHVGVYGSSQRLGVHGAGPFDPRRHTGSRRRLRPQDSLDGRIEAFAVAACVGAPVCFGFGFGFGCDFRGGREDQAQERRGAKMPALEEKAFGGALGAALEQEDVRRGVR